MGIVSFIGGVVVDKLFLGKKIDRFTEDFGFMSDRAIISDLEKFRDIATKWEKEQNPETGWFNLPKDRAVFNMMFEDSVFIT